MDRLFIIALLDQKTANCCSKLSEEFSTEIAGYSLNPHITLATLDVPDAEAFVKESSSAFTGMPAFEVEFRELGYYENLASVSILPAKEGGLMDAFARATSVHPEYLTKFYNEGPEIYLQHLTLVHDGHVDKERLSEIGEHLQACFRPFTGYIREIDYSLLLEEGKFRIIKKIELPPAPVENA